MHDCIRRRHSGADAPPGGANLEGRPPDLADRGGSGRLRRRL